MKFRFKPEDFKEVSWYADNFHKSASMIASANTANQLLEEHLKTLTRVYDDTSTALLFDVQPIEELKEEK